MVVLQPSATSKPTEEKVSEPKPEPPQVAVLATAEAPIAFFRSGNDLIAVAINGDERDFLSPSYPNVARISGDKCEMLGGETELPPYGRLTLNFDVKKRWGVDWGSPEVDGPPNEGRRVVVGAGVTKAGLPWLMIWTSKRFQALGAVEIYVRVDEHWSLRWSRMMALSTMVASTNLDAMSKIDIVGVDGAVNEILAPAKTRIHTWEFVVGAAKKLVVSYYHSEIDSLVAPDELVVTGELGILGVRKGGKGRLEISRLAPHARQHEQSVLQRVLEQDEPWAIQPSSVNSFVLWRYGQPPLQIQKVEQQYVATVASATGSRVERFLATIPSPRTITVLADGRPIALVPGNHSWSLVSDEPVKESCNFPWHKNRPRHKWPGWE